MVGGVDTNLVQPMDVAHVERQFHRALPVHGYPPRVVIGAIGAVSNRYSCLGPVSCGWRRLLLAACARQLPYGVAVRQNDLPVQPVHLHFKRTACCVMFVKLVV